MLDDGHGAEDSKARLKHECSNIVRKRLAGLRRPEVCTAQDREVGLVRPLSVKWRSGVAQPAVCSCTLKLAIGAILTA